MGYCTWAGMNEANRIYHDTEWGIPVHNDRHMFEQLTLECLQCGLSWDLMLKKRGIFRECFDDFDYEKIAVYNDKDKERILNTEGMIRSPRKIKAVINNARCYLKVREEFGSFCDYIWAYSDGKTILYEGHPDGKIPVSNGLSEKISKDLKKLGLKHSLQGFSQQILQHFLYISGILWLVMFQKTGNKCLAFGIHLSSSCHK